MSETRYLIQVVKAGLSENTAIITFKFVGDDPNYTNPEEVPLTDLVLEIDAEFSLGSGHGKVIVNLGPVSMANMGTLDNYYLSLPLDLPEGFSLGNAANFKFKSLIGGTQEKNLNIAFTGPSNTITAGSTTIYFEYYSPAVPFATLNTRFIYCPGGACLELGNN